MRLPRFAKAVAIVSVVMCCGFKNEPSGFRGVSWGTEYSDSLGLAVKETQGDYTIAERTNESMSIGSATLGQVSYIFNKRKFVSVAVGTAGFSNNNSLLDALKAQFGEPIQPNKYITKYYWKGDTSSISMSCDISLSGQCKTYFTGAAQMKSVTDEDARKARESAKDF
ncbi:hypothetical protein NYL07_09150 [Xanthomonas translucens pv. translucens]|uniref:hypothetical protein n=1 Tax=Xanthomonas campestris pv. translucens TaxID=343 RepID=UPI000A8338DA|nr:hypothetical protein [Xanthomonas translucens]MCS3360015.1 hypothetical protein [Xanthomonas translucens pv. translucens]MCS3373750.1 hypothetical protein [Xanthomonas translucens pv. translucens]MCT8289481.1 hypothetical protein [Xanthomonas translucens pv. translucens]MCT8293210.1 hypothetical protein [Xanthomonas translucens pv. translucens]MCT8313269.1 hypothetical protein [Xanthomonas translucens pv. translucens]